jgi:hypothetical protein
VCVRVCVCVKGPQQMLRTHHNLEAYCATLWWRWLVFFFVGLFSWYFNSYALLHIFVLSVLCTCPNCCIYFSSKTYNLPYTPWRIVGGPPVILNLALVGGEWPSWHPLHFTPRERTPGTHWIGGWVGPRACLYAFGGVKNILSVLGIETQIIQPIS